jgi:lipoprotein-releasing system permease protein
MAASFERYVAMRYLVARRKQAFLSLISMISTLGVAVGVMALVVAMALMTGLQQDLQDRLVGSSAHVHVWKVGDGGYQDYLAEARRMEEFPRVVSAAPAIIGRALANSGRREAFITIKGIDPELEQHVSAVADSVDRGSLFDLDQPTDTPFGGIVIGEGVANSLGAFVGDEITLITPNVSLGPMGLALRPRRVTVVGIFRLGLYEYDDAYGFVTLESAMKLMAEDRVQRMDLRIDDLYASREVAAQIEAELGVGYDARDWSEMNQALFSALQLEKLAVSISIAFIVMVAALNIVASLMLLVMEKSRDIAILKTMGAGRKSIMKIFMLQGVIIGAIGTTVGATAGYLLATVLDRYQLIHLDMGVSTSPYVPFTVKPFDFAMVIVCALLICFVATLYPSRQAARPDPAEALRYQ